MSKTFNISLLPGDGTGPEVVNEAVKVLKKTSSYYDTQFNFSQNDLGGDRYLKTGDLVTDNDIINSYHAIHRCIKYAFEYTKNNNRKKITLCAKTNVLTYAHDLWERIFYDVAKDYPEIETDYGHVDAICMWMVKNPEWFDVIVTDNMFGDIITDLGAMIQGGMGIAAGGNINPSGTSMFEPIGGSAPKYTGKNIINPLACIGAGAMMVKELGEEKYASDIEKAIINTAIKLDSLSAGKMGMSTEEVGDTTENFFDCD